MIKYYETKGVHNQDLFSAFLAFLNPHSQFSVRCFYIGFKSRSKKNQTLVL